MVRLCGETPERDTSIQSGVWRLVGHEFAIIAGLFQRLVEMKRPLSEGFAVELAAVASTGPWP